MIRVEGYWPGGPRLFIGRARIHHWHVGAALLAAGVRLVWRDRADLPHPRRRP